MALKVKGIAQSAALLSPGNKVYLFVKIDKEKLMENIAAEVFQMVRDQLPSYYKPDDVLPLTSHLPYNRHGKYLSSA